jgi:hypothetical protein
MMIRTMAETARRRRPKGLKDTAGSRKEGKGTLDRGRKLRRPKGVVKRKNNPWLLIDRDYHKKMIINIINGVFIDFN